MQHFHPHHHPVQKVVEDALVVAVRLLAQLDDHMLGGRRPTPQQQLIIKIVDASDVHLPTLNVVDDFLHQNRVEIGCRWFVHGIIVDQDRIVEGVDLPVRGQRQLAGELLVLKGFVELGNC